MGKKTKKRKRGKSTKAEARQDLLTRVQEHQAIQNKRYWDAAQNDSVKANQWCAADGRHINSLLVDHLDTLRDRSQYEHRINSVAEGVIETHKNDVVGKDGPTLQVESDDSSWNEQAESIWREEFWNSCDTAGELSGGDYLKQGIESLWTKGDLLSQIVTDEDSSSRIQARLMPIDPKRLVSPFGSIADPRILLGVERNTKGRPRAYHISDEDWSELGHGVGLASQLGKTSRLRALDVIHEFRRSEEGQVRGFPWMAGCLQTLGDLRAYDQYVMDAAKVAAMMAVLVYNRSDMQDEVKAPDSAQPLRSGMMNFLPGGWEATSLNPTQPASNHVEYRNERYRELGRPVGMPLMQIRLDSSGHNYSSARFDGQIYSRANASIQSWLDRRVLNRLFPVIMTEAMALGMLRPRSLRGLRYSWSWPQPPHVDPVKEAMAERIRLENKTLSPQRACQSHGLDFETLSNEWKRANELLERNGLPPMLGSVPSSLTELQAWMNENDNEVNQTAA